jgi:hypothetical protein
MIPDCPFCNEKLYSSYGTIYWCKKCYGNKFLIDGDLPYYRAKTDYCAKTKVWCWKNAEYSQEQMDRISKLKAFL